MIAEPVVTPLPLNIVPERFDRTQILRRIPHGPKRLRLDTAEVRCNEGQPVGMGTLTVSQDVCFGHFDESRGYRQILAGVDQEEAAAQAGAVLVTVISDRFLDHAMLFNGKRTFDSQHMVPPGFNLVVHVWLESSIEQLLIEAKGRAQCAAYVGKEQVMAGEFGFVIVDRETYNRLVAIEEKRLIRACRL